MSEPTLTDAGVSEPTLTDAGVTGNMRQHQGVTVSDDPNYTYDLLKHYYTNNGFEATQQFVRSFESDVVAPAARHVPERVYTTILNCLETNTFWIRFKHN